jgi:hypothetical protein
VDILSGWAIPLLAVGMLALLTIVFALFIGRWIDAQSNNVVDEPRKGRSERPNGDGHGV